MKVELNFIDSNIELPGDDRIVLIIIESNRFDQKEIHRGYLINGKWYFEDSNFLADNIDERFEKVTHWCDFPKIK